MRALPQGIGGLLQFAEFVSVPSRVQQGPLQELLLPVGIGWTSPVEIQAGMTNTGRRGNPSTLQLSHEQAKVGGGPSLNRVASAGQIPAHPQPPQSWQS